MRKYFIITPFIVFSLIIIVFFYFLIIKRDPSEIPSALINQKAPVFETTSLLKDESFILEKELGDAVTIINFFATWCIPCRAEHPYLHQLSKEKDVKVLGINYKDNPKKAIQWLNELGNPYSNVAVDLNGHIGVNWGVYGIPETFIINKNNIILYRNVGPITKETYDEFYQKIKEIYK